MGILCTGVFHYHAALSHVYLRQHAQYIIIIMTSYSWLVYSVEIPLRVYLWMGHFQLDIAIYIILSMVVYVSICLKLLNFAAVICTIL